LIPDKFSYKAYPNPFNPYINIGYTLPIAELVNLNIINLLGQKVRTLVNTTQAPGEYYYTWDGKDINGVSLQSGIYFAVINRESGRDALKITFLK
jgi:flagellar hook assembly protein FlgD